MHEFAIAVEVLDRW